MFVVQDEIVRSLVGTLVGRLEAIGAERSRRKPPASMLAYDYLLRAIAQPIGDLAAEAEARRCLEKAIELDPNYGYAQALLAYLLSQEWFRDMSGSDAVLDRALALAKNGVRLDETNNHCQHTLGWIYLMRQDFDLAEYHYQRAIDLNPNSASSLTDMGNLLMFIGRPDEAIEWYKRSRTVDPHFNPPWWWRMVGAAHFIAHRYDEAIAAFNRSANVPAWAAAYIAASHALAGRLESAQRSAAEVLRLWPEFSSRTFVAKEPFKLAGDREHLREGFSKAGLPE
jgi:adenylate cyclase